MTEKKLLGLAALAVSALALALIWLFSRTCTLRIPVGSAPSPAEQYTVETEGPGALALKDKQMEGDTLVLVFAPVQKGRVFVTAEGPEGFAHLDVVYVHFSSMITVNTYWGMCDGARVIPFAAMGYFALALALLVRQTRRGFRRHFCSYGNIRDLGLLIFLSAALVSQIPAALQSRSIDQSILRVLETANLLSFLVLPVAFVVSLLVIAASMVLMRREGRSWRNMLGVFLGAAVCVGTFLPDLVYRVLSDAPFVNLHNSATPAPYLFFFFEEALYCIIAYLECILLSTILLSLAAARHQPAPNKDYMLILGCQIRKDGTLPPLLQGRADAALAFARLQKQKTGKELCFVPSGGQGANEVTSEAAAIRAYLLRQGVPADRILTEDTSTTTYENFRNSLHLIRQQGRDPAQIAYATTGYHVFRAGAIAAQLGITAEGVGGKTRPYFWINAFVREFIAALHADWRTHARVLRSLAVLILLISVMQYVNSIL